MIEVFLAAAVLGQAGIQGPAEVDPGRLAVYSVEAAPEASSAWRVFCPEASGLHQEDVAAIFEQNRNLAFASPVPGRYVFVVAVADSGALTLHDLIVVVRESPGPEPGPGPEPIPSNWRDFADKTAGRLIPQPFRSEEGKLIAAALRKVAADIGSGALNDARAAREAVRIAVRDALATVEAIQRWKPFSDAIDAELDKPPGTDRTLADYAAIWSAIAEGLDR
ncbi:MAG: hypothetical protein GYA63_02310 [Armatimonadetes bacterium]|nr:hypothetical protein [Armatimonadota bacterium]